MQVYYKCCHTYLNVHWCSVSVPQLHLVQAWRLPTRLVLHLCTSNRINPPRPPPSGRTPSVGWIHLNVLLWPLWPILLIIPVKEGEAIETPLKLLLNCQSRHVVVLFLVLNFCRLCMLCLLCLCLINLSITIQVLWYMHLALKGG